MKTLEQSMKENNAKFVAKICKACDGRGSVGGAMEIRCVECNGRGYVKVVVRDDNPDKNDKNPDICGGCTQQRASGDADPKQV